MELASLLSDQRRPPSHHRGERRRPQTFTTDTSLRRTLPDGVRTSRSTQRCLASGTSSKRAYRQCGGRPAGWIRQFHWERCERTGGEQGCWGDLQGSGFGGGFLSCTASCPSIRSTLSFDLERMGQTLMLHVARRQGPSVCPRGRRRRFRGKEPRRWGDVQCWTELLQCRGGSSADLRAHSADVKRIYVHEKIYDEFVKKVRTASAFH